jgi:N-acetyl-anhydromuramyl-L-alanine amidase AmpD
MPELSTSLSIDTQTFRLAEDEYFRQSVPKDLIVLHFTAGGSARSAYDSWHKPCGCQSDHVATPFVVETNGTVYQLFEPDGWAYHLGMLTRNPGHFNDRRSIAIEIVNVGPLKLAADHPEQLVWWPGNYTTPWCNTAETERYVRADFRGFRYFAAFPPAQVAAVRALVDHLCDEFKIRKVAPPGPKRGVCDPDFFCRFQGLASHQNFRADKVDIGPAWDWGWLL